MAERACCNPERIEFVRCTTHGLVAWEGHMYCERCGVVWWEHDAKAPKPTTPNCSCGVRFLPRNEDDVEFSARTVCGICARGVRNEPQPDPKKAKKAGRSENWGRNAGP